MKFVFHFLNVRNRSLGLVAGPRGLSKALDSRCDVLFNCVAARGHRTAIVAEVRPYILHLIRARESLSWFQRLVHTVVHCGNGLIGKIHTVNPVACDLEQQTGLALFSS